MRRSNYCLGLVLSLALTGCATRYEPRSIWNIGGYSETLIAPDTFRVRFDGNERMLANQGDDFARLRAAELCLARKKAFMRLSQFSTDLEWLRGPRGRFVTPPKDASSDTSGRYEHTESLKRTKFTPARAQSRSRSHLTVVCESEEAPGSVSAAALADVIRARYRLEGG